MKNKIALLLCIVLMPILLTSCQKAEKVESPRAVKGVIDLSNWDFDKNGQTELKGEWEYYPGQLLEPEQLSKINAETYQNTALPKYPTILPPDVEAFTPKSFGTYRLKVVFNNTKNILAIYKRHINSTPYKIWLNNKLIHGHSIDR